MLKLTLEQAMRMSGVYDSDSEFERDIKFRQWIANRKYCIADSDIPVPPEIEILIIKETKWKATTT